MRERLAEGYLRFRAAQAKDVALSAPPEAGGSLGAYHDRNCPNCDAFPPGRALLRAHGLDLVTCPACTLTYTRQVMDEIADEARYQASEVDAESISLRCSAPYLELETARSRYYLDRLKETCVQAGSLFEVGCGTGTFLLEAQAMGWDAFAIEPGLDAAKVARKRGARVIDGYFPRDLSADLCDFDVIAMLDVLEHIADPRTFLRNAREHLAANGRLFIQVPNWDSLIVQLEGTSSTVVGDGHWSYFTPSTLPDLLARAGFRTLFIETVVSEIDRIAKFTEADRDVALTRLRPALSRTVDLSLADISSADFLHEHGLGYKLIGIFEPI